MPFNPDILSSLHGMNTLACSSENLTDDDMFALCKALENNNTITALYLPNNMIGNAGAKILAECLIINKTLHTIVLDNNAIGNEGATALAYSLEQNKVIQTLSLNNNSFFWGRNITTQMQTIITRCLERNRAISKNTNNPQKGVVISCTSIKEAEVIAHYLSTNNTPPVVRLQDSTCLPDYVRGLGSGRGCLTCEIAEALKTNTTVHEIEFNTPYNQDDSIKLFKSLAEALMINKTIHTVTLDIGYAPRLPESAMILFIKALLLNKTIHTIHLNGVHFNENLMAIFAKFLSANKTVHTIDLSNSKIDNRMAARIAEILQINTTIHTIDLTRCQINDNGVKSIANTLKTNKTIHAITLSYNSNISSSGIAFLAEALKKTQQSIHFAYNLVNLKMAF